MYKYRLYPNKEQVKLLTSQLKSLCNIYNHLLKIKINVYKENKRSLSRKDLNALVKAWDKHIHSQVRQNVADRVDKAFNNFFNRIKLKKSYAKVKVGFPRFKADHRYNSLTYPQSGFNLLNNRILHLSKIGDIIIKFHRPIEGKIKTLSIKRSPTGKWYVCFSCEVPVTKKRHKFLDKQVGIDVGLENFATLSTGNVITNPRYLIKSENKLSKSQRCLSRKFKGSKNRTKARLKVAKLHEKITNQRMDFLHKQSHYLSNTYNYIVVESLNIKNMMKNRYLAKHIADASWNTFIQLLSYKAASAGGQLICVDPKYTSIKCSCCGKNVPKKLSVREHNCPFCDLKLHRDHNAAINILHSNKIPLGRRESTPVEIFDRKSLKQDAPQL